MSDQPDIEMLERKAQRAGELARLVDEWAARAGAAEATLAAVRDVRDGWQAEVEDDGNGATDLETVLREIDAALTAPAIRQASAEHHKRDVPEVAEPESAEESQ